VYDRASHLRAAAGRLPVPLRATWLLLFACALLAPVFIPYSLPWLRGDALTGWSTADVRGSGTPVHVVRSSMRHATAAGLMTGDVVVAVDGVRADSAVIARAHANARVGDTITLATLRRGEAKVVRVPVLPNPASLTAFFGFRVAVAVGAAIVALLILVLRAGSPAWWPLAAALVLVAPTTFPAGIAGDAWWAAALRWVWQTLAAAYRFAFPILIAHFLALNTVVPAWLRDRRVWLTLYAGAACLLLVSTHGLATPLAWTQDGWAKDIRLYSGAVLRLATLVVALHVRFAPGAAREVRWFADAVLVNMAFSVITVALLIAGIPVERVEIVSRMHSIVLFLIPVTAGLLLTAPADRSASPQVRRGMAGWIAGTLTALYGLAIAGVAAVVLTSAGRSLDGLEWVLFLAIFLAAVLFSPVLQWSRGLVDRRLFARWLALETRLASALDRISRELEPERITRRIVSELPVALEAVRVRLILSDVWAARLGITGAPHVEVAGAAALPRSPVTPDAARRSVMLPLHDREGRVMAALCVERASDSDGFDALDEGWQRTLSQGVAAALCNADTFHQLRRAQNELAEGERIAATGALAAGLAHEIKNPLAGLRIGLHLLGRDGVPQPRLDRMLEDLQRISDLVSTLLTGPAHARGDELLDLGALLQEGARQLQPLAEHRGARLSVISPAASTTVRGDRDVLRIVISNLLRNAIDAVDEEGAIDARVESDGTHAWLVVRNTGEGIPEPEQKRLFELHHSTKPDGSGLGLALARREVEQLGGAIEIETRAGAGATLRVRLPIAG
jgi:signal transduction histidine kinase